MHCGEQFLNEGDKTTTLSFTVQHNVKHLIVNEITFSEIVNHHCFNRTCLSHI